MKLKFIAIICGFLFCVNTVLAENVWEKVSHFFYKPDYNDEKITQTLFPPYLAAENRNVFIFDPNYLIWAAYNKKGRRVGVGRASGGKNFCPDIGKSCRTVIGAFSVFRTEDSACSSKTFPIDEGGGAPMPYCMFFHGGYAIHGSNNIPSYNASHGCIRIKKVAAKWLNTYYLQEGDMVIVKDYKKL